MVLTERKTTPAEAGYGRDGIMRNYLAFDLGASSGRAMLGTLEAGKLTLRELYRFQNGPLERDGRLCWDYPALVGELRAGLAAAAAVTTDLAGIGIDTWGVDYVLFRRSDGTPVRLPFHYRDARTADAPARVFAKVGRGELYRRTGIQFLPFNTLYQLCAHQEAHPEDFFDSAFLLMPDALGFALGGDFSTEYTIASTTNLLDPVRRWWDWALIDRLGLPRSIFPEIAPPCTRNGMLAESLQKEFGLGEIPLIKVGSHDTAAAVAAVPAAPETNWAYISCGTWALLGCELEAPRIGGDAEAAGFTNEGGIGGRTRFLSNIMGCWLLQETRRTWQAAGIDRSFGELAALAAAAAPFSFLIDPNSADFLAPGDMPGRIAAFCARTGQGRPASDGAVLRGIYDSLALCFRDKLEALEKLLGLRYASLHIVGGGTQDRFLMQTGADVLGLPVIAGPVEATAAGNVLAQALALGDLPDLAAAREAVRNSFPVVTYHPDPKQKTAGDAALARFRAIKAEQETT